MSSGPIEKVHMIILMQPDLDAAIAFYEQLGVKLVFHLNGKWAEMKIGTIKLGLCPTDHAMDGHRTGIVLQVADVRAVYEQFKQRVSFLNEPKEAVHGIMVSFKDPGGNLLDLYQPTPERVAELVRKTAQQDDDSQTHDQSSCVKAQRCCKNEKNGVA